MVLKITRGLLSPPVNWPLWYSHSRFFMQRDWQPVYSGGVFFLEPKGAIVFFVKKRLTNFVAKAVFAAIDRMEFKRVAQW